MVDVPNLLIAKHLSQFVITSRSSCANPVVDFHTIKQDMHYDIISAFIKSMRGSDPDVALWLACAHD